MTNAARTLYPEYADTLPPELSLPKELLNAVGYARECGFPVDIILTISPLDSTHAGEIPIEVILAHLARIMEFSDSEIDEDEALHEGAA